MTDISVKSATYQVEKRDWLLSQHGTDPGTTPSVTLDVSKFTAGTHYPNGYVPSGTALGIVTATGMYGPYNDAASDGTQVCRGLLFSSCTAVNTNTGTALAKVGGAMVVHGFIQLSKLPFQSGTGFVDAAGQTDLKLIHFVA